MGGEYKVKWKEGTNGPEKVLVEERYTVRLSWDLGRMVLLKWSAVESRNGVER